MVLQGKRCQGPDQDPASQNQSQDHPQDQDQGLHPDQCQGQNQGPPQDQCPDRGQSQRKAQETRVQFLDPHQDLQSEEVGNAKVINIYLYSENRNNFETNLSFQFNQ